MWFNAIGNAHKICQVQPFLTHWECVGESCAQFLSRSDGLMKVPKHAISKKASTFKRKQVEIATDLHEMASNDALVAMYHFIASCRKSLWQPMLIGLKGADKVSKHSGRVARNMDIARCTIKQKITHLKATIEIDPELASFCDRKVLHVSDSRARDLLCKSLPSLVASETESVFENHFIQWLTEDSLSHLTVSEPPFATLFCQHLFDLPVQQETVQTDFAKVGANLPSLRVSVPKC